MKRSRVIHKQNCLTLAIILTMVFGSWSRNGHSAVTVLKQTEKGVIITHPPKGRWRVGQEVCFVSGKGKDQQVIDCAEIAKVTNQQALIFIEDLPQLGEGDRVVRYENVYDRRNYITLGLAAGLNYYFPYLQYQFQISPNYFIGIAPVYFAFSQSGTSLSGYGGTLTFNLYANRPWRSFWFLFGLGYYQFKLERSAQQETKGTPVVMSTVGWRGKWRNHLTIGFGIGAQWAKPNTTLVRLKFSGLEPLIVFDFGFHF